LQIKAGAVMGLICAYICVHNSGQAMAGKELEFEWDEAKARINLEKHRVSFLTAAAIFLVRAIGAHR
jgi:hypothetical protein